MKTLLAVALTTATVLVAAPAHAEDHRPCVSKVEYRQAMKGDHYRRELERSWETTALPSAPAGLIGLEPMSSRSYLVYYKRCGFSVDESWFAVEYRHSDNRVVSKAKMRVGTATLHGRP